MNNNQNSLIIDTIDDVPAQCLTIMMKLYEQKSKNYYGSAIKESKVLQIDDWNTCKIVEILSNQATNAPIGTPFIQSFGQVYKLYSKNFFTKKKQDIGNSIQLFNNENPPTIDALLLAYKHIMNDIKSNWHIEEVAANEQKTVLVTNGEWIKLIKQSVWAYNQEILIKHLANKMNLGAHVISSKYPDSSCMMAKNCCMYVKKSALKEIAKRFDFYCLQNPNKRAHTWLILQEIIEKLEMYVPKEIAKEIVLHAYPYDK